MLGLPDADLTLDIEILCGLRYVRSANANLVRTSDVKFDGPHYEVHDSREIAGVDIRFATNFFLRCSCIVEEHWIDLTFEFILQ